MRIYKYLLFLLAVSLSYAQPYWTAGEDILTSNGNYYAVTSSDSVFFDDDTLYICGDDTLYIFVNTGKTKGMIAWNGTVSTKDTMGYSTDSSVVYFDLAIHRGTFRALNSLATETYYAMDSCKIATGENDEFRFYPFQNTNLDQVHCNYYTLRIRGRESDLGVVWIREERVRAF